MTARSSKIHDWREDASFNLHHKTVIIGANRPNSRNGAIPSNLTAMTWCGPVAKYEDAEALALSDAKTSWKVLSYISNSPDSEMPEYMCNTRIVPGSRYNNTILPGRLMRKNFLGREHEWLAPVLDRGLASVAADALLAAASRAHLPPSGRILFQEPGEFPYRTSLQRFGISIDVDMDDWRRDWRIPLSGCLRKLAIALSMLIYSDTADTVGWTDHGFQIPRSATLAAGLTTRTVERTARVAEFLRSVGLPDVAHEFLATYAEA